MKYEICKVINDNGKDIYATVAWTDVRTYAQEIADALFMANGNRYIVLVDGKPMK